MAQIEMRIIADNADDLRETLGRLLGSVAAAHAATLRDESTEEDSEPGKRRRRTKAEMQAAEASNSKSGTSPADSGSAALSESQQTSGPVTTADPFNDQLESVQAEDALLDDSPAVTKEDVKAAMGRCIDKIGAGKTQLILKQHANDAGSLGAVDPKFYPAVLTALKAELA